MFSQLLTFENLLVALGWAGYGAVHSWLASTRIKAWVAHRWPAHHTRYRLGYNLLAIALLIPLAVATELADEHWLWQWEGGWGWFAHAVSIAVVLGFAWSSRAYDLREFMGVAATAPTQPVRFGLSPLHRCVRHPWYFLGLLWLWTRDMDAARLTAALVITGYVWLGSRLEDGKLEQELGAAYRSYRAHVPGLLPRPWRCLSRAEFLRLRG